MNTNKSRRAFIKSGAAGLAALTVGAVDFSANAKHAGNSAQSGGVAAEGENHVIEPQRRIPVCGETDVAVIGGGIAGVAAALAAARSGVKVSLLEKSCLPGGLATLGNVVIYLPLCDGYGHQVSGGLCEELIRLSVRHRPNAIPACWQTESDSESRAKSRFLAEFNPWDFALDMEALLVKEGVDIWYDTRFCDVLFNKGRIDYLLIENKSGRQALRAKAIVDASGDADVCVRSGQPTVTLQSNVRAGWFFAWKGDKPYLEYCSRPFSPTGEKMKDDPYAYTGSQARDVNRQLLDSRQLQRERLKKLREENPAAEPVNLNTIPDIRMTTRLQGVMELKEEDMGRWFEDSIGFMANWRRKGPVYAIPYRSLYAPGMANLITAGRCISSAGSAWDQSRAIPACAVTGEAAGTAAALLAQGQASSFSAMPIEWLQTELRRRGVIMDTRLVEEASKRANTLDSSASTDTH